MAPARDDLGKLLLRLAIGVLLLLHGIAKLRHGIGWMGGALTALGLPAIVGYGVFVGELVAPVLALIGKLTRLAGLLIATNMLAAVYIARRDGAFTLGASGGWAIELEALFLAGGLLLFLFGSGRYALSRGKGTWD